MRRVVELMDRFSPGTRIGDYVVDRVIDDELGETYEATHTVLPRRARIDVMQTIFVGLRPIAERMMREASIIETLRHPGVPRVYEVGRLADKRPWVASELVDGVPLSAFNQPLPAAHVIGLLRDVAAILAYAHERGIVHRSIAPEAIIYDNGARGTPVCLLHWSRARVVNKSEVEVECADDVFALAVVAHALLVEPVPALLTRLLDDMMAPEPAHRPTAAEVSRRAMLIIESFARDTAVEDWLATRDVNTRWTPVLGVASSPELPRPPGIDISVSKPRT